MFWLRQVRAILLVALVILQQHLGAHVTGANPLGELPEFPRNTEALICFQNRCEIADEAAQARVCAAPDTVLHYDVAQCFVAAGALAGYQPLDLTRRSAGEIVWCYNFFRLIGLMNYTMLVTPRADRLEACVATGRQNLVQHVLIVYSGWKALASANRVPPLGFRIRPPFREECLITMTMWPINQPGGLWPGDLRYYLTMYPAKHNPHTLIQRPLDCPVLPAQPVDPAGGGSGSAATTAAAVAGATAPAPLPLPRYGVLFGKFKTMRFKANRTSELFHDAALWAALAERTHLVVVECADSLTSILRWPPDFRTRGRGVTCWNESPLRNTTTYTHLLAQADFVMGLGETADSPTPVQASYCRTPLIMPPRQHALYRMYGKVPEYYPATSAESVLAAVDAIQGSCGTGFIYRPMGPGPGGLALGTGLGLGAGGENLVGAAARPDAMGLEKTSTCIPLAPSFDWLFADQLVTEHLEKLLHARRVLCRMNPQLQEGKEQLVGDGAPGMEAEGGVVGER